MKARIVKIEDSLFYLEFNKGGLWIPIWKPFSNKIQIEKWLISRNIKDYDIVDRQNVKNKVISIIRNILKYKEDDILDLNSSLYLNYADSLDAVQIILYIESDFGITIEDMDYAELTPNEIIDIVISKL